MHVEASSSHGAYEALAGALQSDDIQQILPALRTVKNHIIGNKSKKQAYTRHGIVSAILDAFSKHKDERVMLEAAVALGCLAYGNPEGLKAILGQNGVQHFISALNSKDERLTKANLRALKIIYQDPAAPRQLLNSKETLQRLVTVLNNPDSLLSEDVAVLLSAWCCSAEEKRALADAGAVEALVALLSSSRTKAQDAAVEALAALSADSAEVSQRLLQSPGVLDKLLTRCRDPEPRLRFTACAALAHVASGCRPEDAALDKKVEEAARPALLVLVQLLHNPSLNLPIPHILATLLKNRQSLVGAAADKDAVRRLSSFLCEPSTPPSTTAGALSALGTLCLAREDCRSQLCEKRVISVIVQYLQHSDVEIQCAATQCVLALTRPLKNAKGGPTLLEAGVLATLVRLVSDASTEVQTHAVSALANLVLDLPEAKSEVVKGEGLGLLVRLLDSMEGGLRLQATWALKNLTNAVAPAGSAQGTDVVKAVVAALPWASLRELLGDPEASVQVQAMALLRNIATNQIPNSTLMEWAGGNLLPLLEERLEPARQQDPEALVHVLYAVSNLSVSPSHRSDILHSRIPSFLARHIGSSEPGSTARKAAVWCVINLCWSDGDTDTAGRAERVARLREMGLQQVLQEVLQHEACGDTQDRVRHALDLLK